MRSKNIVIQKADKCNTVVIIDKEKYIQGVNNVIFDSSKSIALNIPPEDYLNDIVNVEKIIRKLFHNLYNNNKITEDELLRICLVGSRPGILYGNPKVHRLVVENMPKFIQILSTINTPGYNLAKFLIPILEPLTHKEFTVKDSFSFAKEITKCNFESLFTNIPLKEAIDNCVSDPHNKIFTTKNLTNLTY